MTENITTLITGAGAVKNSWDPIAKTIKRNENIDVVPDVANQYFALRVYLMKYHQHKKDSEKLTAIVDDFGKFKGAIAESLRNAQSKGELCIRPEFIDILNKFLPINQRFAHINTNWDSVVDCAIAEFLGNPIKTVHIHGEAKHPETLYLPSEVHFEPYRNDEEKQYLGEMHAVAAGCFEKSNRIILYGISLDPMDAELQMLFSVSITENLEEIIIINLKKDHAKIAARIKMLIASKFTPKISAYDPEDLTSDILSE